MGFVASILDSLARDIRDPRHRKMHSPGSCSLSYVIECLLLKLQTNRDEHPSSHQDTVDWSYVQGEGHVKEKSGRKRVLHVTET